MLSGFLPFLPFMHKKKIHERLKLQETIFMAGSLGIFNFGSHMLKKYRFGTRESIKIDREGKRDFQSSFLFAP